MKAIMYFWFGLFGIAGCGDAEPSAPECRSVEDASFEKDTGWGSPDYCEKPTTLGCYPFFGSSESSCKAFQSMRTEATPDANVQACQSLIEILNCTKYIGENGDVLEFTIENESQLKMHVFGSLDGRIVDSSLFLNPCQNHCLSGISLKTLNDDQQKICEIPRQGLPTCLFPETAHNITFRQVTADRLNLVLGGKDHLFTTQK